MRPISRSTIRVAAAGLLAIAAGFAQAPGAVAATSAEVAPSCVEYTTSWRYTFVTNGCDAPQHVTVEYRDGSSVPCRTAEPGDTVTFPGYGTGDNRVVGVVLCPTPS
ncbi:alpha-amylase [Streptomyces sp. NPDC016309]|uniref:alpha-amylase n=1 Tax=Streptomyces sp. NPDC016309 TaxID=3364965 RepID=UPI0036F8C667